VLTGFPWNLPATAWTAFPTMVQPAAYVGAYGLTFITVVLAAAPALLFEDSSVRSRRAVLAASAAALVAWAGLGTARLSTASGETVAGVTLRLVQGNVAQSLKWAESQRDETFARYLALTARPGFERVTHVVWPETAIDYRFETDYRVVRIEGERKTRLAAAVPNNGALILGAIRDQDRRWYNSVHVVTEAGNRFLTYDKHHLVPFGEYVPLRRVLLRLGIEQIAHGSGDYSAGPGPASLPVAGAPAMSPLICYEAIFPGRAAARRRPGWLVNVTNDAWFGLTSGPYQHFAGARLRAVEEGLPLARAANTGITAVVDAHGRVTARLPIMRQGVLDAALPAALAAPTLYARLGDRVLLLLLLLAAAFALAADLRQGRAAA
jgi:apolipoprotein N-acyltransferase